MPSNKIIDSEIDKDAALTYTAEDLYNRTNDTAIILILQRRVRKLEKQMDRLLVILRSKISDPFDIQKASD